MIVELFNNGTRVFETTPTGVRHLGPLPVGTFVPYIIGIPSVRAEVLGLVGENYVLRQEYDFVNEEGKWEHVKKDYYRDKKFIEGYWLDTIRQPGYRHGSKGI
ncbi:MAG: hypothetical protein JRE23_03380 [Deltaproteobacteria bacterium]|nr:hypothetical protein [Deltaproteobacteria bacterium]